MKIEIELTDEQAVNFRIEHDGFIDDTKETMLDVLQMIDRAIMRQAVMLGDIVTLEKESNQMIVRGLHGGKAWCWVPDIAGKWVPIGSYDLTRLKKFNV